MISSMAQTHGMKIIVYEIMTWCLVGSKMLMTLKCPESVTDQVSNINFVKWLKVGFLLESVACHESKTMFYEKFKACNIYICLMWRRSSQSEQSYMHGRILM